MDTTPLLHAQQHVTRVAIRMHNSFQMRDLPTESPDIVPSRWILSYPSRVLCLAIVRSVASDLRGRYLGIIDSGTPNRGTRCCVQKKEKINMYLFGYPRSDCSSYCSSQVRLPTAVYPIPLSMKKRCIDRQLPAKRLPAPNKSQNQTAIQQKER